MAPEVLGPQLLLRRGVIRGLVSLIRPQHLTALADWEARPGAGSGRQQRGRSVPGLVAAALQEGVLHPQPALLRDMFQVCPRRELDPYSFIVKATPTEEIDTFAPYAAHVTAQGAQCSSNAGCRRDPC